jgi:phospholipid transport system substrate-binding protein
MNGFPTRIALGALALCAACAASGGDTAGGAAADLTPDALVKKVTLEVIDIVAKDKDIQAGDRAKTVALVEEKILQHFDFTRMTALALSTHWAKASAEQKAKLVEQFRILLVRTYASSIAAYRNQRFDFRPLRANAADTDVTVTVRVLQPGTQPVLIEYDMEKTAAGWKAWDLRVAGISLVLNYRTELGNIARESGIDGVIRGLVSKNQALDRSAAAGARK